MDLVAVLKDKAAPVARFAQKQLLVWLAVMHSPVSVVSKVNLRSSKAVAPALRLVVFVYAVTLLVAIPKMFLYQKVAVASGVVVVTDFVATALGFGLVGLTLYGAGRLVGGRGRLFGSMVAGLYLTALWPIVQVTDYVLLPELPAELGPRGTAIVHAALFTVIAVFVVVLIVVKASPVMAHVHAIGRARATIAVLVQGLLMFLGLFLFLRPLFEKLAGKQ